MQQLTAADIRDFRIRGNFLNWHTLAAQQAGAAAAARPGYSAPILTYQLEGRDEQSLVITEADVPPLVDRDHPERPKQYLALLLNANAGDAEAARELRAAQEQVLLARKLKGTPPNETQFVVPCTSTEPHTERDISQKADFLLKLTRQGYPVPDFVVVTAQAYAQGIAHIEEHVCAAIEQLETIGRRAVRDPDAPLVFAIRCATPFYIPGVMDTFLNVGATETALPRLEAMYGPAAGRRMLLNNLRNICAALEREDVAALATSLHRGASREQLDGALDQLCGVIRQADPRLLEDGYHQAAFLARQAYKHFEENHDLLATLCRSGHAPALILQKMVCTVRGDHAYAGVISSRHTQTGVGMELQTGRNIFGEEMMTGSAEIESTTFDEPATVRDSFPAVHHFAPHLPDLERDFEAPVTIEFAAEATERYQWFALLQLNETGMAGRAALISAVDMHQSGAISRKRVTELVRPYHIKQLTSDSIDQEAFNTLNTFCSGVAVLPRSAVSARIYFSSEAAISAKRRGELVCLCKKNFVPTDTVVMREMDAIISLTSAAIHVVTICQNLGIPALLSVEKHGVELLDDGRLVNSAGREIRQGDWITVSSRRRAVYEGQGKFTAARLLRYMKGEDVGFENEQEAMAFDAIAYAYRYYQQLVKGVQAEQISSLTEIARLVNFELRTEREQAKKLVNGWFDDHEELYVQEVLKSDIGDHLVQSNVFEILSLDRKVRFFKLVAEKCAQEKISGYEAGAFMIGRFLSLRYPVAFWKAFTSAEIALLVNEWVLFEKYMQLLHKVGERKVLHARKKILKEGLDDLHLHPGNVHCLITVKLAGAPLEEAVQALPAWSDPQSVRVLELLQQPYEKFFDFHSRWSVRELEKICEEEKIPVPAGEDA
ncbi:MAG: hypothetical protein ACR2IF_09615 [Terriglobales bacterium]